MPNNIPFYLLNIDEEKISYLKKNIKKDVAVPAILQVNGIAFDVKTSYRGSYTRKLKKRSYTIDFENPVFEGVSKIHINAEYNDPSLFRNKLSLDFFQEHGVLAPNSQHINLIRNDKLKGVYLQLDSVDQWFLKNRGLPPGPIYYATNNDANFNLIREDKPKKSILSGYKRIVGEENDDQYLHELITTINNTPLSQFPNVVSKHINMESYIRWFACAICTMNNDGFTHNYALYRNSETGLFEILPWDYDATWGRRVDGGKMEHTYVPLEGKSNPSNHLCTLILQVDEYRNLYKNTLLEMLETTFTVDYMEDKVMSLYNTLRPYIHLDPYKRKKIAEFDAEPEFIFNFIQKRNKYIKKQLKKLN